MATYNPISLKTQPKQVTALKQSQLLMMLPQMQQAITLLQMPVMELTPLIEAEMERNPLLEQEETDEDESIEEEETDHDDPEREISFDENDFETFMQMDEQWRESLSDQLQADDPHQSSEMEKRKSFLESNLTTPPSLFSHLMNQAKDTFSDPKELLIAESLIGNFDEYGYLKTSLEEIAALSGCLVESLQKILEKIQTFDPFGVGARSVQECLLIQLRCLNKADSLAYKIIRDHYEDLIHNHIPKIQKSLSCQNHEIRESIEKQIAKLDLRPGAWYALPNNANIVPDILIRQDRDQLFIDTNDDFLPTLRLNRRYMSLLEDKDVPAETKEYIQHHLLSAKWLSRNIRQRNETLIRITEYLTKKQDQFFSKAEGELVPLTMKEVAQELHLHESTIARAVANKYVNCSRGLLPLRAFFTTAYSNKEGKEISSSTVQGAIQELIKREDKKKPLTDEKIVEKLQERGIVCARRTVSKHRRTLNIGNTTQRKKY